jgi:toxin ParE1/3/4
VKFRLTREAEANIVSILRQTKKLFGPRQVQRYAKIIEDGVAMVAEDPNRPSSQDRTDLRPGVRSFHLELVTLRRHSASHILYFTTIWNSAGEPEVVVIGVLAESMEPKRRLSQALRGLDAGTRDPDGGAREPPRR